MNTGIFNDELEKLAKLPRALRGEGTEEMALRIIRQGRFGSPQREYVERLAEAHRLGRRFGEFKELAPLGLVAQGGAAKARAREALSKAQAGVVLERGKRTPSFPGTNIGRITHPFSVSEARKKLSRKNRMATAARRAYRDEIESKITW
jgi:hypothetical protein